MRSGCRPHAEPVRYHVAVPVLSLMHSCRVHRPARSRLYHTSNPNRVCTARRLSSNTGLVRVGAVCTCNARTNNEQSRASQRWSWPSSPASALRRTRAWRLEAWNMRNGFVINVSLRPIWTIEMRRQTLHHVCATCRFQSQASAVLGRTRGRYVHISATPSSSEPQQSLDTSNGTSPSGAGKQQRHCSWVDG